MGHRGALSVFCGGLGLGIGLGLGLLLVLLVLVVMRVPDISGMVDPALYVAYVLTQREFRQSR